MLNISFIHNSFLNCVEKKYEVYNLELKQYEKKKNFSLLHLQM